MFKKKGYIFIYIKSESVYKTCIFSPSCYIKREISFIKGKNMLKKSCTCIVALLLVGLSTSVLADSSCVLQSTGGVANGPVYFFAKVNDQNITPSSICAPSLTPNTKCAITQDSAQKNIQRGELKLGQPNTMIAYSCNTQSCSCIASGTCRQKIVQNFTVTKVGDSYVSTPNAITFDIDNSKYKPQNCSPTGTVALDLLK